MDRQKPKARNFLRLSSSNDNTGQVSWSNDWTNVGNQV